MELVNLTTCHSCNGYVFYTMTDTNEVEKQSLLHFYFLYFGLQNKLIASLKDSS